MAVLALVILVFLLSIAYAAPTYHAQAMNRRPTVKSFYDELMENVCSDLTVKTCVDHDGYTFRYSIFDPVSLFCVCSTQPSQVMVSPDSMLVMCLNLTLS